MQVKGYFTTVCDKTTVNNYVPTLIDERKKNADILLTSICGNYYTLFLNNETIEIKGRGVKVHSERSVSVTETVYNKLLSQYTIETDF